MLKDFTYVMHKNKLRDNEELKPEDLNTQFTEHSIANSELDTMMKNNSTKSVVLAPFNSREGIDQERMLRDA